MAFQLSGKLLRSTASCMKRVQCSYSSKYSRTFLVAENRFLAPPSLLHHQTSRTLVGWLQRPCKTSSGPICKTDSKTCSWNTCCSVHSENRENLINFLSEEIKLENENQQTLPKIKDFQITPKGSDVELTKTSGREKITINFNVNHTVNSVDMPQEENQADESDMVSKPPFTIEISKDGETLSFSCAFTEDIADPQNNEQYADSLEIEEVSVHKGEWDESVFTLSSSVMDGNLYDHFLDLLKDRGIDEEFVEQLIEFSTVYEHGQYLDFLKNLQKFVK